MDMDPIRLARILYQIAAKLDNSKNPSQKLVLNDLKRVLASLRMANDMTVADLIGILQKEDPSALVGAGLTTRNGWVNTFKGVKHAEDGTVVLDLSEETTTEEEIAVT
jgi:hypothetical protein